MTDISLPNLKDQLYKSCLDYVDERIASAELAIADAAEAASDDTKSSAGDKYETGREMMQQEIDRHKTQLVESRKLRHVLLQINPARTTGTVQAGSLVTTGIGIFYISISRGQISIGGKNVFAVSAASPIGQKLLNRKAGDALEFNGKPFTIEKVD